MRKILFLGAALLFLACNEEASPDVITLEDLVGDVGEPERDSLLTDSSSAGEDPTGLLDFAASQMQQYDTLSLTDFHLMDRFSYSFCRKLRFKGRTDVPYGKTGTATPRADFFYYTFPDSVRTRNAFYNYLDGMAEEGEGGPVKLMEDVKAIKMPPMQMFVYDTTIIAVHYTCEAVKNNWRPFQDSLFGQYGKNYKYRFDVSCGGPLIWER